MIGTHLVRVRDAGHELVLCRQEPLGGRHLDCLAALGLERVLEVFVVQQAERGGKIGIRTIRRLRPSFSDRKLRFELRVFSREFWLLLGLALRSE
jgi:hypothetical protein